MSGVSITFTDNPAIAARMDRYAIMTLDIPRVLASWRASLMAHEWLDAQGRVRAMDALNMLDREKILQAEKSLAAGESLPRPVLGIGIFDNIEIGTGREIVCLLALQGGRTIEAHVPISNRKEFEEFLVNA